MKRILLLVAVLISVCAIGQGTQPPINQTFGSPNSTTLIKGVGAADSVFYLRYSFPDTTSANRWYLKNIPGAQIRVGDTVYMRNNAATKWQNMMRGGGGGATPTWQQTLTAGSVLSGNNTVTMGLNDVLDFQSNGLSGSTSISNITSGTTNSAYANIVGTGIVATNSGGNGQIYVTPTDIVIQPPLGVLHIDTLNSGAGTKALRWNASTGAVTVADTTTGGGNTNSNVGSGYRLAIPWTNDIKTLGANYGIILDSATSNQIGVKADSATLSNYYLRRKDSLTSTNALGYVTKTILSDTAAAIRAASGGGGLGTLDTLPYPPWTVVQDGAGTSYKSAGQRVFNVKDYGATGDGSTDDTRAIQAAINAAHANFGGVVYFPIGHYIIADSLRTTSVPGNPNAQLYIPLSPYSANTDSLRTIELIGEVAPNYFSDPTANKNNPTKGVLIESTLRNTGNLIGASSELFGGLKQFNFTYVKIKNIKFRTDTDSSGVVVGATQTAIDASRLAMFSAEDVSVDVANSYLSVLPNSTAYGIRMPVAWNYVMSELKRVSVQGMYSGISLSEHADLSNIFIDACYNGIEFLASDYGAHIDRIIIARCVNDILVSGTTIFTIDDLNVEYKTDNFTPVGAWFNTQYVINETTGSTLGYIRSYTVVESGVGLNNALFNRNTNNSYITAKTANRNTPVWTTSTRPSLDYGVVGYNKTLSTLEFRDSLQNVWQTVGSNRGVGAVSYNQGTGSGATTELSYDEGNNWLNVRSTTSSYNTTIGQYPSAPSYGGVWLGNNTPSASNYTITGDGSNETVFNGPTLKFRIGNGSSPNAISIDASSKIGVNVNSPTSTFQINGSFSTSYVAKAVDYTVTDTDNVIEVTATGKTITLRTAVGITGRVYTVKLTASGSGTVATTSSQTIDGSTTYSLSAQYKYVTVQSNGANWIIIANN